MMKLVGYSMKLLAQLRLQLKLRNQSLVWLDFLLFLNQKLKNLNHPLGLAQVTQLCRCQCQLLALQLQLLPQRR
jgi:hypothetical protein